MNPRILIILATLGSAALLLGAFGFQHLGGMAPCKLCLWQRWPHAVAIAIGVLALVLNRVQLAWIGAIAALVSANIGLYHTGVEQGWWEGPTTCTSGAIGGLSADELLSQIMDAPLVRCDDIAWQMAGLSMAGWNMVLSLILAGLWIAAARR
ncbi:disulfide bond formation protein B [Sulfitobacter sp. SK012]|uniref:disulfide bond formation protein B n=1 Tax=Sulfitobacter sp. SK012 TaxID=1389005 RepID=UPI000E0B42C7|nr:disulfide bond formation protein B [Sulfitobacter sp. SK012]AXI46886.1 disulfide bond formation protein B [Sulfitobacter sp. SK012]